MKKNPKQEIHSIIILIRLALIIFNKLLLYWVEPHWESFVFPKFNLPLFVNQIYFGNYPAQYVDLTNKRRLICSNSWINDRDKKDM